MKNLHDLSFPQQREFQTSYIRPHLAVDSAQWDWGIMPKSHCAESTAEQA